MQGWKTYLTNFLLLIPLLLDRFTAIIPPAYLDEYAAAVVLINFVLRRLTVGPDGISKMLAGAAALLVAAALPLGAIADEVLPVPAPDLGNPTLADAPPEPSDPDDPPATSIVKAISVSPTDRCQCEPCQCDVCVCGYDGRAGRWESRRVCEGDTCRIDRVWVPMERGQATVARVEDRSQAPRHRFRLFGRRR